MIKDGEVLIQEMANSLHKDGSKVHVGMEAAEEYVRELAQIAKAFGSKWCKSFLDVGCRRGYASIELMKQFPGADVFAIDVVEEFVKDSIEAGVNAVVAPVEKLPYADKSIDWTFCSHVLEHCTDINKAIREIVRVTRRGVYIAVPLESREVMGETSLSHNLFVPHPWIWMQPFLSVSCLPVMVRLASPGCVNFVVLLSMTEEEKGGDWLELIYRGTTYSKEYQKVTL